MKTISTHKTPIRLFFTVLLLAGALLAAYTLRSNAEEDAGGGGRGTVIPLFFTDNLASIATSPAVTPLEQALLKALQEATTSIDAAIYDFDRASVRDALLAAQARGVTVRVVSDDEARLSDKSKPAYDALQAAGILVVEDGPVMAAPFAPASGRADGAMSASPDETAEITATRIMHDKYLIIDRAQVWTGSVNMSDTDLTLNHNHAMLLEGAGIAAIYQSDFEQMIGGVFGTLKSETITKTVLVEGVSTTIHFAPQDDPMTQIIAEIDSAQTSIDFAIFYFTHDGVRDALLRALARGVQVRGLWDLLGASNAYSDDEALCQAGVAIKIENTRGLMHHKSMVIDAQGSAPRVIAGSLNWTEGGNEQNNENTLILRDGALAATFAAEFEKMWNGITVAPCAPAGEANTRQFLPIVQMNGQSQPAPPTPQPIATPVATPIAGPGAGAVEIVRVVYDPDGDDVVNERVVLINRLPTALNLGNWTLHDDATNTNIFIFPNVVIAPGGELSVWVKAGVHGVADVFWGRGGAVWNNDGDIATLLDSAGEFIDGCAYAGGATAEECLSP